MSPREPCSRGLFFGAAAAPRALPGIVGARTSCCVFGLLRILAAVLVAQLSLMAPAMGGATTHGHGADPADLICSGHADSAEARAALAELSDLIDGGSVHRPHTPEPHDHREHCPACALAKAMALPAPDQAANPAFIAQRIPLATLSDDCARGHQAAGPPVGLRAPPLFV
jgi:hypothetical protein